MDFYLQAFLMPRMPFLITSCLIQSFQNLSQWVSFVITSLRWRFFWPVYCPAEVALTLVRVFSMLYILLLSKNTNYYIYLSSYLFSSWAYKILLRSRTSSHWFWSPQHLHDACRAGGPSVVYWMSGALGCFVRLMTWMKQKSKLRTVNAWRSSCYPESFRWTGKWPEKEPEVLIITYKPMWGFK